MKKSALLLKLLTISVSLSAQQSIELRPGDIISGIVYNDEGPLSHVSVVEVDSNNNKVNQGYVDVITDKKGRFLFFLADPMDSLNIIIKGYKTIKLPIERSHFEIHMERLSSNDVGTSVYFPADPSIIEGGSDTMKKLQEYAPVNYVCGYVIKNSWGKINSGLFLVKETEKYSLVYKHQDKTDKQDVAPELAKQLESSVNSMIARAEAPMEPIIIQGPYDLSINVDGNIVCAVTPQKAANLWTGSDDIPDAIWHEEYLKFK